MRTFTRLSTALLIASVALAGCGGSGDADGDGSSDAPSSSGSLVHVDGTIELAGDTVTVTPKEGGEAREFTLGPAVEKAQVAAIASSGEPARVLYREDEDGIAASVGPAPKLGEGVEAYEGQVVSVSDTELVIDGSDGERTFDISGADPGAFDRPHLEEHKSKGEAIRVYFQTDAPEAGIAYEDA